jgi:hypothetical protein
MDRTTCSAACRKQLQRRPAAAEAVTAAVTSGTAAPAPVTRGGISWATDDDDDELGHWIPVR